jgi:hypothetical protein
VNGHQPRFQQPFPFSIPGLTPREQEMLAHGMDGPSMDELDLAQLAMDGRLPPEFWNGPDLSMFGRDPLSRGLRSPDIGRRVLEDDADLATRMPELGSEVVARRGVVGDSLRMLEPNNLGNGIRIPARIAGDNIPWQIVVQARGTDALNPIGITLGYEVTGTEQDTDDIFVQALIKWGVGGGQNAVVVDVGRGTQLRLTSASFVEVSMRCTPDPTIFGEGIEPRTSPELLATALLGYGNPSFRPSPARFTQRLAEVADGGAASSVVRIPKFAQSFGVIGESGSIAGSTATMVASNPTAPGSHTAMSILTDGQEESQYFVPNGMRWMQITNNSPTSQRFNIVFALML